MFQKCFLGAISYLFQQPRGGGRRLWIAVFRDIKGENGPCLADSRAVLPVSSSALEKHLPFVSLEVALDSTPHFQTSKNKCHPQKPAEAGTRNEFSWQSSWRVWEKRAAVVSLLLLALLCSTCWERRFRSPIIEMNGSTTAQLCVNGQQVSHPSLAGEHGLQKGQGEKMKNNLTIWLFSLWSVSVTGCHVLCVAPGTEAPPKKWCFTTNRTGINTRDWKNLCYFAF